MALAALHLLGHVKSTRAAAFRGLYALAVDDAGRRRRLAPDGLTRAPDETAIDAMPSPVFPQTEKVALHGRARRKFSPERPPLTAGSKNVKNGIHYGSQIRRSWASYSSRRRHQRLQQRPFRVCRVACKAKAVAPILQASDFSPRHGALHRISQIRRNHIRLKSLTSFSARLSGRWIRQGSRLHKVLTARWLKWGLNDRNLARTSRSPWPAQQDGHHRRDQSWPSDQQQRRVLNWRGSITRAFRNGQCHFPTARICCWVRRFPLGKGCPPF